MSEQQNDSQVNFWLYEHITRSLLVRHVVHYVSYYFATTYNDWRVSTHALSGWHSHARWNATGRILSLRISTIVFIRLRVWPECGVVQIGNNRNTLST